MSVSETSGELPYIQTIQEAASQDATLNGLLDTIFRLNAGLTAERTRRAQADARCAELADRLSAATGQFVSLGAQIEQQQVSLSHEAELRERVEGRLQAVVSVLDRLVKAGIVTDEQLAELDETLPMTLVAVQVPPADDDVHDDSLVSFE